MFQHHTTKCKFGKGKRKRVFIYENSIKIMYPFFFVDYFILCFFVGTLSKYILLPKLGIIDSFLAKIQTQRTDRKKYLFSFCETSPQKYSLPHNSS